MRIWTQRPNAGLVFCCLCGANTASSGRCWSAISPPSATPLTTSLPAFIPTTNSPNGRWRNSARLHARVHVVVVPHEGPTSKGDCLNWAYRGMEKHESLHGFRYDVVMTHDAEDLVEPESLRLVNWFSRGYAMVQVPVLALPTPAAEFTHGLYCDEFAEYQTKDIPMRQLLGGFLPANGVGTGFARAALEHLASTRAAGFSTPLASPRIMRTACACMPLGTRRSSCPSDVRNGRPSPRANISRANSARPLGSAADGWRGSCLQGWRNHGWRGRWPQAYWFWRDRKGLVGNLVSPLANLVFLAGLLAIPGTKPGALLPLWLARLCLATYGFALSKSVCAPGPALASTAGASPPHPRCASRGAI